MAFIRLNAGHDKNGNPRRAYVLLGSMNGQIVGAWDEGYEGLNAIPLQVRERWANHLSDIPTIPTTRSYLRSILKQYGDK